MHEPSAGVTAHPAPIVCQGDDPAAYGSQVGVDHVLAGTLQWVRAPAQLGDAGEATRWLGWAANGGFPYHPWFEIASLLAPVRKDLAYSSLLDEVRPAFDRVNQWYAEPGKDPTASGRP